MTENAIDPQSHHVRPKTSMILPRPDAGRKAPRSSGRAANRRIPSSGRLAATECGLRRATKPGPAITTATPVDGINQQARTSSAHAGSSMSSISTSSVRSISGRAAHRHGSMPITTSAATSPPSMCPRVTSSTSSPESFSTGTAVRSGSPLCNANPCRAPSFRSARGAFPVVRPQLEHDLRDGHDGQCLRAGEVNNVVRNPRRPDRRARRRLSN